jgi:microcystin-dependent protein
MSEPYVGQIATYAFNFAISDWSICAGQTMAISQYEVLYALLGTTYGGNATSNFMLPDLRGRSMIGASIGGPAPGLPTYPMGNVGGQESVALSTLLAQHTHVVNVGALTAGPTAVNVNVGFTGATMNVNCNMIASLDAATSDKPLAGGMLADVAPNGTKVYGAASTNTANLQAFSATGTFSATATGQTSPVTVPVSGSVSVTVQPAGNGSGAVPTISPYLALNHQIALVGVYPSRQ